MTGFAVLPRGPVASPAADTENGAVGLLAPRHKVGPRRFYQLRSG